MNKVAKTVLKLAAGTAVAYLAVGEGIYERLLNRKFTQFNNLSRVVEPDILKFYDKDANYIEADAWYVTMNPEDTVLVNSKGKNMHARILMQNEYSDKWAVVIHGYTSCSRGMADQAFFFYKKGFNVILPDLVSFGEDEQKYCSMGYHDKDYIKDWIRFIVDKDSSAKIALLGVSMGSATTMLTTGEPDIPDNVKCAVADCGYTSVWDEYSIQCKETYKLPAFPFMHAANTVSKLRGNFDFKKCSPIKAVSHSKIPTLFIHGEEDTFVPYFMMDKLYNACTAEKEKLSIPGTAHADSCWTQPELYYSSIDKFIDKYI